MEVINIFITRHYDRNDAEGTHGKSMARQGMITIFRTLTTVQQESYETVRGIFHMFDDNFKPQHNETILSLQ